MLARFQCSDGQVRMAVVTGCYHDQVDVLVGKEGVNGTVNLCIWEIVGRGRRFFSSSGGLCGALKESVHREIGVAEDEWQVEGPSGVAAVKTSRV